MKYTAKPSAADVRKLADAAEAYDGNCAVDNPEDVLEDISELLQHGFMWDVAPIVPNTWEGVSRLFGDAANSLRGSRPHRKRGPARPEGVRG